MDAPAYQFGSLLTGIKYLQQVKDRIMQKKLKTISIIILVITAFFALNTTAYAGRSSKVPPVSVKLKRPALSVKEGQTVRCIAHVVPRNASQKKLKYRSLNTKVAKISPKGLITGLKPGRAVIVCSVKGAPAIKSRCTVIVAPKKSEITFSKYVQNLFIGESSKLIPYQNGMKLASDKVTFVSSNPQTVSVDASGNIKALQAGTAAITVKAHNNAAMASCTIRINNKSSQSTGKTIFVGASRTKGKEMVLDDRTDNILFITKSGARLPWFHNTAFTELKKILDKDPKQTAVICMGVNDMQDINGYISLCRELMTQYPHTKIYITTITPIDSTFTYHKDSQIRTFNRKLKAAFGSNVINTYRYLNKTGYETIDGIHYEQSTCAKELDYILDAIGKSNTSQ